MMTGFQAPSAIPEKLGVKVINGPVQSHHIYKAGAIKSSLARVFMHVITPELTLPCYSTQGFETSHLR